MYLLVNNPGTLITVAGKENTEKILALRQTMFVKQIWLNVLFSKINASMN